MRTVPALCCLLAASACHRSTSAAPTGPPRLEPPPETGQVAIDMAGIWRITDVVVLEQAGNVTEPLRELGGLMPPLVGETLTFAAGQATMAATRDLARQAAPFAQVAGWLNQADGRFALYYRYSISPPVPGQVDGGGSETLQFALGSVDADTIAGFVQHSLAVAFPPRDRPVYGLYRIELRRQP